MCSKLTATFVPFSVLSLIRPRTIKVASTSRLSFALFRINFQTKSRNPEIYQSEIKIPREIQWISKLVSQARPHQPQRGSLSVSSTGKVGSGRVANVKNQPPDFEHLIPCA